jgi:hypothetical protein
LPSKRRPAPTAAPVSYAFLHRIQSLARARHQRVATVLASVITHEPLAAAAQGALLFSADESARMRAHIAAQHLRFTAQ